MFSRFGFGHSNGNGGDSGAGGGEETQSRDAQKDEFVLVPKTQARPGTPIPKNPAFPSLFRGVGAVHPTTPRPETQRPSRTPVGQRDRSRRRRNRRRYKKFRPGGKAEQQAGSGAGSPPGPSKDRVQEEWPPLGSGDGTTSRRATPTKAWPSPLNLGKAASPDGAAEVAREATQLAERGGNSNSYPTSAGAGRRGSESLGRQCAAHDKTPQVLGQVQGPQTGDDVRRAHHPIVGRGRSRGRGVQRGMHDYLPTRQPGSAAQPRSRVWLPPTRQSQLQETRYWSQGSHFHRSASGVAGGEEVGSRVRGTVPGSSAVLGSRQVPPGGSRVLLSPVEQVPSRSPAAHMVTMFQCTGCGFLGTAPLFTVVTGVYCQ